MRPCAAAECLHQRKLARSLHQPSCRCPPLGGLAEALHLTLDERPFIREDVSRLADRVVEAVRQLAAGIDASPYAICPFAGTVFTKTTVRQRVGQRSVPDPFGTLETF